MADDQSQIAQTAKSIADRLSLRRPLVFLDLETTGNDPQTARIVEISAAKVAPDGSTELVTRRVNPEVPIPPEAAAVHGITDRDVEHKPPFRRLARSLVSFIDSCDLAGFGISRFDVPVLKAEFRRAGHWFSIDDRAVLDSLAIYFVKEPRDLRAALRFYKGRDLENAHSATADMIASMEVLDGQLNRYADLPRDLTELDKMSDARRIQPAWLDEHGLLTLTEDDVYFNFGRHKGKRLSEVVTNAPDYLEWIIKGDFPEDVKAIVAKAQANHGQIISVRPADT